MAIGNPLRLTLMLCLPLLRAQQPALFDYDRSAPFQYQEEIGRTEPAFQVAGAGIQAPRGGKLNMLVVRPRGKGPYAGIVIQHGGGQTMLTYLAEAGILARAGAIVLIIEAPGARPDRKPLEQMSGVELRDYNAEIVVCERRAIDYLESLPTIDRARLGFVGHSYGGITGGILAGIEPRLHALVLIGAIPRYSQHIATSPADLWEQWRKTIGPGRLAAELGELRPIDPDLYLRSARHGPLLFQCGNFDDDNRNPCVELVRGASLPKEVRWYDTDHSFADIEAALDRLQWLGQQLRLKRIGPEIQRMLASPRKQTIMGPPTR